jgi:signal transduction histidine kinase
MIWHQDVLGHFTSGDMPDLNHSRATSAASPESPPHTPASPQTPAEYGHAVLLAVADAFASAGRLDDGLRAFLRAVCEGLQAPYGALWCATAGATRLTRLASWYAPTPELDAFDTTARSLDLEHVEGMFGQALGAGAACCVNDLAVEDTHFDFAAVAAHAGLYSTYFMAFELDGEQLAVAGFFWGQGAAPRSDATGVIAALAPQLSHFIHRMRVWEVADMRERLHIEEQLRQNERHLALEYALTRALAQPGDLAEVSCGVLQAVCEGVGWELGALWMVDPQTDRLRCTSRWQAPGVPADEYIADTHVRAFARGEGLAGNAWQSGHPLRISDVTNNPIVVRAGILQRAGLRGAFIVPIHSSEDVIAVMEFFTTHVQPADAALMQLLEALGIQIGGFLQRLQTEQEMHSMARFPQENPNVILRISRDGRVVFANDAGQAFLTSWGDAAGLAAPRLYRELATEALARSHSDVIDIERGERVYSFTVVPVGDAGYVNFYGVDVSERIHAERTVTRVLSRTKELYDTSRKIGLAQTATEVLHVLQSNSYFAHASRIVVNVFDRPWDNEDEPPLVMETFAELSDGLSRPSARGRYLSPEVLWLREIHLRDGPFQVENAQDVAGLSKNARQLLAKAGTSSLTLFPLIARGQWYGILSAHFVQVQTFSDEEMRHIQGLVDQVAIAIYNMRLFQAEAEARREAEKASELRLKFLAMISHELRTPLTPIKGMVTTLLADDVEWSASEQHDFLTVVNEETDKLTEMIEQLLDLSRMEAGLLSVHPTASQLGEIIDGAAAQLLDLTAEHVLKMDVPDDLPPVNADGRRIGQVLANLVSNAAKYSPAGSEITISAHPTGGEVQVDVADQGPGIPESQRPYLFKAFFRGEDDKARQTKGAGLGLAICKGLIEAHGGHIWYDAGTGTGTVISFTLPIDDSTVPI